MTEQPATLILGFGDELTANVAVRRSTRSTSVSEFNEMLAKRVQSDDDDPVGQSGGLIIETEHEMPALEALLNSYKVKTAVIVTDSAQGATTDQAHALPRTWKERVEAEFHSAVASAHGNTEVAERLWFLSALSEDELEGVVSQARAILAASTLTPRAWERFLEAQGRKVSAERPHAALEPLAGHPGSDAEQEEGEEQEQEPLFSLADLGMTFTAGAIGRPRPLADRS